VARSLTAMRIVPVVELASLDQALPMFDALTRAQLPLVEITLRTSVAVDAIMLLRESHPNALIGAGTVLSTEDVRRVASAGADFAVSPSTNPAVIELCHSLGLLALPGACTPTDIDVARRAGTTLVKFFPAEAMGGVKFIKALAGPFRDVSFIPTGGINASNLAEYLRAPRVVACGGSWMVAPRLLNEREFQTVEALAREAVRIAERALADE